MKKENGRYSLFGNYLSKSLSKKTDKWQKKFSRRFQYDPGEKYTLSLEDNPFLGPLFGLKNIIRGDAGEALDKENGLICSTIRMGFGHYRIAMSAVSAAKAMGFNPYWLDLLAIPGITTDVIKWCNDNYSRGSRMSQRSRFFNKHIWEATTSGEPSFLSPLLETNIISWNWRHMKTNIKDYKMSELFRNLHQAFPRDMPILTAHMWNCMGAVAGGMNNVVDMMFDNWPMSFQLTEGAKHACQSPSAYYGFRVLNRFGNGNEILKPMPAEDLICAGHFVDHELVENIEEDCQSRLRRMNNNEPRRFMITMGGAGAQSDLFKAVIEHCIPLVREGKAALFVNLGDHKKNWERLKKELGEYMGLVETHFNWEDTRKFCDGIRSGKAKGIHVFLYENIFHAVYATNYLMRAIDIMITKPSELAFYPVPKIFNERVGGHEMWGAVRGAEIGDSTIETRSIPDTLQAIDIMTHDRDLLTMYCENIIKNKSTGIYDGAYKCVELATGRKFKR